MKAIYALGARFAGGGIGSTAYHAVGGLYEQGLLQRLLAGSAAPSGIPRDRVRELGLPSRVLRKLAMYDPSRWVAHMECLLFDSWASRQLEPADVFHVWGNYGLRSLHRAKAMGMVTVVERASTHPLYQARVLRQEYARWGVRFHLPQATLSRGMGEIRAADYVLIPSDFVRDSFLAEGFPAGRLLQVPFGVDTERFRPAGCQGTHPFRVLFVGQVGIRKGVPYLLEAWRLLGWRDAELWLVGRVDRHSPRILHRWPSLPGVHRVDHTPDPVALFQQADVFAFPTIEEGSALVTYEALACGLPVVTTPSAGSIVTDGSEGFITLVHSQESCSVMWYNIGHENSYLCSSGVGRRAPDLGGGAALV